MLRKSNNLPLDYSLCDMTVTVYRRQAPYRQVINNAYYEFTDRLSVAGGVEEADRNFLLIVPGFSDLRCGDAVVLGQGEMTLGNQKAGIIESVKPRYFRGQLCHTEARGDSR